MLAAAKYIGAGLACSGLIGAGAGIGLIFSSLIASTARNPQIKGQLFTYAILGFALAVYDLIFKYLIYALDTIIKKYKQKKIMLAAAKYIGAGLACSGLIGAGAGIGLIFSSLIASTARNPQIKGQLFTYAILGFALAVYDLIFKYLIYALDTIIKKYKQKKLC